jgi:hypothetical protein
MLSFENAELLSKSQILEEQVAARAKQSRKKRKPRASASVTVDQFDTGSGQCDTQSNFVIRPKIGIVARHKTEKTARLLDSKASS